MYFSFSATLLTSFRVFVLCNEEVENTTSLTKFQANTVPITGITKQKKNIQQE